MHPAPEPSATPRPRRRNADRSAETRLKLLDATIESLAEVGWAATSTTEVVRRAGVSRGAQVHHFPAKEDMVLAAVEHLMVRRHAEFDATFRELPDANRSPVEAMRLLRDRCFATTFEVWLELVVASRNDPALHQRLLAMDDRFFERSVVTYNLLFPELTGGDLHSARIGLELVFTVLDGIALRRLVDRPVEEADEALEVFVNFTTAWAYPDGLLPPQRSLLPAPDPEEHP